MEALIKAPEINTISVSALSANYATLDWDDVGRNFYYLIEMRDVTNAGEWVMLTHLQKPNYTLSNLKKETEYQIRIAVSSRGFEMSEWTYSDIFKTFMYNLYNFSMMNEMILSDRFIDEKFTSNNKSYINFNRDTIYASLMNSDFTYSPHIHHVSYLTDSILRKNEYHEVLGDVSKLCTDVDRVMGGYIDQVLYLVERYQRITRVSNNKGQTWQTVEMFDGRVGNPIANSIFSQNSTTTYSLGYDYVFYGRPSSNIRWSSIRERFSQTDISFTRMDDQLNLGYEIEVFNRYATLPQWLQGGVAEAFSSNNDKLFVAGNGKVVYIDIENSIYDEDPSSPTYQQRIFGDDVITIVNDERAVIKKMDSVGDTTLVLVTGRLKAGTFNKRHPNNIERSDYMGVYQIKSDNTVVRVFGETEEERREIEHEYTNMSTNGKEFYISYANYKNMEYMESVGTILDDEGGDISIIDSKTVNERGFLNSAKPLMGSWRCAVNTPSKWVRGFMKYYMETHFTYMSRSNNRVFITNERRLGIVHGERLYTQVVDTEGDGSDKRVMKEVWDGGRVTIYSPNIYFSDFSSYASGILLYQSGGQLIGFYEFAFNAIDEVSIIWKPRNVMLSSTLIGQTRPEQFIESPLNRPEDPNLVPFIKKMIPENYFRDSDIEQSRYYSFIQNYLEYLSDGRDSPYIGTLNTVRNRNPFEVDSFEYLWSEMYKRNIYLDSKKKEEAIKFFLSTKNDFYSAKGTVASYKYLFKLLYNEDVEIDDDTDVMNYYLTVDMTNIDQNIIGQNIFTNTGRCVVSNIERIYLDGRRVWQITIGSMIGSMKKGQIVRSENSRYSGTVVEELNGRQLLYNDLDYINKGKSYYVMRIKSTLPISRYKDDITRFVHPLGVPFKGIVDITLFMNAGINMKHTETIIDKMIALKMDMGIPTHYPDRMRRLGVDGKPIDDPITGLPVYSQHPRNGEVMIIDTKKYDSDNYVNPNTIKVPAIKTLLQTTTPNNRRSRYSPTFDSSSTSMSKFRSMVDNFIDDRVWRFKDDVGNPRDSRVDSTQETQKKLDKEL